MTTPPCEHRGLGDACRPGQFAFLADQFRANGEDVPILSPA